MPSTTNNSHFRTLQRFKIEYSPSFLTQYESSRTGLRVVVVDQQGPKVLGYFALATEIDDDSGAPHTLEHLCFMGSKSYKYKGILDKLATRAYSTTNAWTATDHTAYTLDTAGWEGFAQILPVYLEHVIVPTLTDAGCYTEVHHVDGEGHDAGVVYSEMQGVQNNQGELMELQSKRLLYPEGIGFRYETGGMMEQLRVLTANRIRQFHRDMYQPKNLCVVVIGEVDHENLLAILDRFEGTILDDIPKPDAPFKRPWVESKPTPTLKESSRATVDFPEEDEETGEILISYFGPDLNNTIESTAVNILLTYLAGSSASVLENVLVEREQLATAVYYSTEARPNTLIQFSLSSVATEKLSEVETRFFELLGEIAAKDFDLNYIKDCIRRERRQVMSASESSASVFADSIIKDFLFGNRDGSNLKDLETLREYDVLEAWTDLQWQVFFRKWISDAPHVVILGRPSAALSSKLRDDERARVAAQKERLGEEGLRELRKKLARAKTENDREIPQDILRSFKVPKTSSIRFITTTTARSGAARQMEPLNNAVQAIIDSDDASLPLFIHFEHVPTNFVHLTLLLGTESIPVILRPLLPIYLENLFNSPLERQGRKMEFEQVIMALESDTVSYRIDSGSFLGNPETLAIRFQVEPEKYETAIEWLRDLLNNSMFDLTRIKAITTRLLADIPEEKRDGNSMAYAIENTINTEPASITRARGTLTRAVYLKRVRRLLEDSPDTVLSQLEEIRSALYQFSNFRALVTANVEQLPRPVSSWKILTNDLDTSEPLKPLESRRSRLTEAGKNPGNTAYIVPLPTIDSSFAVAVAKGPSSFDDPRLPILMVTVAYLDAVEGPMWTAVRGTGLAYGTSFSRHTESGQVSFDVYRSPDAHKAFGASKNVIESFVDGSRTFDDLALEGAISSIVLAFANAQSTMASAAQSSFIRQVIRALPADWNQTILQKVRDVKVQEIKEVIGEVLLPVFKGETANLIITCAPIMEEGLKEGFERLGFKPQVRSLASFQDDYGLKAPDGIDELDEDEEADDDEDLDNGEDSGLEDDVSDSDA